MATKIERPKLITPVFVGSFPACFEARAIEGDANSKPKFGISAIWRPSKFTDKEKAQWRAIIGELDKEAKRVFKMPWKELPPEIRRGIRDGAAKPDLAGYGEGTRFANLTSKIRPGIVDLDGSTLIGPEHGNAELIYPGVYLRATVQVFSYNNKGKGVALGLRNLQRIKDGQRLDNRVAAEDDFDEEVDAAWLDAADDDATEFDDDIPF